MLLPRSRARSVVFRGLVCASLAAILPAAASGASCAGRFEQSSEPTVFDGLAFDMVKLRASSITLFAFTFAAWMPDNADPGNRFGFTLRHQTHANARVGICPLTATDIASDDRAWAGYLAAALSSLGPDTLISEELDSSRDEGVVEVLGWRTRQAKFSAPGLDGGSQRIEYHVVATGVSSSVAFVLTGAADEVALTLQDFRFLLSRLSAE